MSGLSLSSEYADVLENSYIQGTVTVTTSAIEAKVGASRLTGRENIFIYNASNATVYFGPTNAATITTGIPILKGQSLSLNLGDSIAIFLIAAAGSNSVIVAEFA